MTNDLLAAYDRSLRAESEMHGATQVTRIGPLWLGTFPGGRGLISYSDLAGANSAAIRALVARAVEYLELHPEIVEVEWKTRGHDHAPGLDEALREHGFEPGPVESVMVGQAASLAVEVPLPDGVVLRRITAEDDIRRMAKMQAEVFGSSVPIEGLLAAAASDRGDEFWIAEAAGEVVSAGRMIPVAGTEFAGIWGGATHPAWRGHGIYRALTAARARSALRAGKTLIHSDSTPYSRPILERYGFTHITDTTPYQLQR